MDLCAGTDQPIEANDEQVTVGIIPGGRCAVLRYPGNTNNLSPPRSTFIEIGFRPAARKHVTSRTIPNGGFPSFQKCQHMKW